MKLKNIRLLALCTLAFAGVSCKPDEIQVVTVSVKGVSVQPATATLQEGETLQLEAVITPADATEKGVEWSSNNDKAAIVDANGLVTALAPGSASITVKTRDGGHSARCRITVKGPEDPGTDPGTDPGNDPGTNPGTNPTTYRTWEDTGASLPDYPTYNPVSSLGDFPRIDITWEKETRQLAEGEYTWENGTVRFRDPKGMY